MSSVLIVLIIQVKEGSNVTEDIYKLFLDWNRLRKTTTRIVFLRKCNKRGLRMMMLWNYLLTKWYFFSNSVESLHIHLRVCFAANLRHQITPKYNSSRYKCANVLYVSCSKEHRNLVLADWFSVSVRWWLAHVCGQAPTKVRHRKLTYLLDIKRMRLCIFVCGFYCMDVIQWWTFNGFLTI
jgi:hypothetical protein